MSAGQPTVQLERFRERLLEAIDAAAFDEPAERAGRPRAWRKRALVAVIAILLAVAGLAAAGKLTIPGVPDDVIARFAPWRRTHGLQLRNARLALRVTLPPKAFISDQYGALLVWELWRAPEEVGPPCEQSRMVFAHGETFGSVGCRGDSPVPSLKRLDMDSWQNAPGHGAIVFAEMWPGARSARGVFAGGRRVAMHVQGHGAWLVIPPHKRLLRLEMLNARGHVMHVDGDIGGLPG